MYLIDMVPEEWTTSLVTR